MNFDDEAHNLARAIARVLADGPAQKRLRGVEPPVAMVARDAVVGELRMLSRIVRANADRRLNVTDPTHVDLSHMHNALCALPVACREGLSLSEALAIEVGPYCQHWQAAARAAIQLELYHDVLDGPQAQGAMVGLAYLASTVSSLDDDLHAVLPGRSDLRAGFASAGSYAQLTRACGNFLGRVADSTLTEPVPRPFIPRVLPVRSIAAVPVAMRHLAELIERQAENITAHEIRAASRVLLEGTAVAIREFPALSSALKPLQAMTISPVATLNAPSPRLMNLAAEIRSALAHDAEGPAPGFAAAWAESAVAACAALLVSVTKAGESGRLLLPAQDVPRGNGQRFLWSRLDIQKSVGLSSLFTKAVRALEVTQGCQADEPSRLHVSGFRGQGIRQGL